MTDSTTRPAPEILTRRDRLFAAALLRSIAAAADAEAVPALLAMSKRTDTWTSEPTGDIRTKRLAIFADALELDYDGDDVAMAERAAESIADHPDLR